MPVSQWVMLHCLLAWHSAYSTDSATEILNTSEICLRTEVQYLGNAAWYGVGVNRWPTGNHPSFMLYRLARSPLTQRDWSQRSLWPRTVGQLCPSSVLITVPCTFPRHGRHHKKVEGGRRHSKKIFSAGICAPNFECFRRHWSASRNSDPPVKIWQIQPWKYRSIVHCQYSWILESFRPGSRVWQTDRQTDTTAFSNSVPKSQANN